MHYPFTLVYYGGPDQLIPLTSGVAAAFTFLLIFWNKLLFVAVRLKNWFLRAGETSVARDEKQNT